MKYERIHRTRNPGWHMPPNTIAVTRNNYFSNPFTVGVDGTAQECVDKFIAHVKAHPDFLVLAKVILRGHNLACWCPIGTPCHADYLLKIVNEP